MPGRNYVNNQEIYSVKTKYNAVSPHGARKKKIFFLTRLKNFKESKEVVINGRSDYTRCRAFCLSRG